MNTKECTYFINGDEPPIIGDICQSLYLMQYQEGSQITDQANVVYFQFSGKWYRLYFEGSTIFWRETEKPEEPINSNLESALALINLNECTDYVGKIINNISYSRNATEISAELAFEQGKSIKLLHNEHNDTTCIKC